MAQVESRAYLLFKNAIKSRFTLDVYNYQLNQYLKYSGKANYDDLLLDKPEEIQKNLENYLLELRDINSPSMIKAKFYPLFLFFSMNDVIINQTKLKKMFPIQELTGGGVGYTNEDIKRILEAIDNTKRKTKTKLRSRALIHFFSASGCRVGAINYLTLYDIKPIKNCYSVKVYAGSVYEYVTFLTPEATKSLNEYLENRSGKPYPESLPIGKRPIRPPIESFVFPMCYETARMVIDRLVKKANVSSKTENGRYTIPLVHGFRKRFNTILKSNNNINLSAIERMMGHSSSIPLDENYYKPTIEKLFEEYEKGIPDLSIFKHRTKLESSV